MKRRTPSTVASRTDSMGNESTDSISASVSASALNVRGGSHAHRPRHHHDRSTRARITRFVARAKQTTVQTVQVQIRAIFDGGSNNNNNNNAPVQVADVAPPPPQQDNDRWNYALLILLYTLQGIPMGLSASIPFLLQEKIAKMAAASGASLLGEVASASAVAATKASYNANAIFALCSWPFSLKLLWAPIVDSIYMKHIGRRKSWLVPVQTLAGLIMVGGANFVERQLGLSADIPLATTMNIRGVTSFFFVLYFLMATQDIAVDGWALTMLSKANRGRGPICNSIGQNIGYFLSFVGFLALNDVEASETLWRPLFRLPSNPTQGLVRLRGFLRFMGFLMLATTFVVAVFKRELPRVPSQSVDQDGRIPASTYSKLEENDDADDEMDELDASTIGLRETYHRLWAVCQLPAVRMLFLVLVTYRLPVALSDNVKFLKAVEYGLSKSTTALLSPTLILPLGILVPIVAHKIWHKAPLQQFTTAYRFRVTLIPLLDLIMLHLLKSGYPHNSLWFWAAIVASTAGQAICNSLQFNAQMMFFASRVDPAIGGSYMTLLNTAANLGGTWPSSFVMWLLGTLTRDQAGDPYTTMQCVFSAMGVAWLLYFGPKIGQLAALPADAWRTHLDDKNDGTALNPSLTRNDMESGDASVDAWQAGEDKEKNK